MLLIGIGLVWGLAFAPPDYQQGNSFRLSIRQVALHRVDGAAEAPVEPEESR